jgi:hypothetical protein
MHRSKWLAILLVLGLLAVPVSAFAAPDNHGRHIEWTEVTLCVTLRDGSHETITREVPEFMVDELQALVARHGGHPLYIPFFGFFKGASWGACQYEVIVDCEQVVYGDTLEGLSIEMFGGPSYYYLGYQVVCTDYVGLGWGENCVPALGFPSENLVPGLWVCPAPSPGTGE